jgi:hypothetical protein
MLIVPDGHVADGVLIVVRAAIRRSVMKAMLRLKWFSNIAQPTTIEVIFATQLLMPGLGPLIENRS